MNKNASDPEEQFIHKIVNAINEKKQIEQQKAVCLLQAYEKKLSVGVESTIQHLSRNYRTQPLFSWLSNHDATQWYTLLKPHIKGLEVLEQHSNEYWEDHHADICFDIRFTTTCIIPRIFKRQTDTNDRFFTNWKKSIIACVGFCLCVVFWLSSLLMYAIGKDSLGAGIWLVYATLAFLLYLKFE